MARRTIVALEDDLDGGPADETVRFGVGGSEYEIDLSEKNAAKLRKQLAPFVDHARRASGQAHRPVRTAASRRRSRDIRAWARDQGIELSERGRIPAGIAAQYEAEAGRSPRRLAATSRALRRLGRCPRRHNRWYLAAGHDIVGGEVTLAELAEGGAVHVCYSFRASRLVLTSPARGAHGESWGTACLRAFTTSPSTAPTPGRRPCSGRR